MQLSVIIVNYNVKYFLEQCLHSVERAAAGIKAEIIVVDNNSSDGSIEYLLPDFPNVIFIRNDANLGFGKANNLALQSARGEYILFLNPDTLVPEECFEKCIQFLEAKPVAGALGIRMIDGSGRFLPESKRSFPTSSSAFYKLMGLSGLFPSSEHFNKYSLRHLDEHSNHPVEVLAGAFMMIRKKVLDHTGGFDETFFMYGEDIDLSYRIRQAGYENWYYSGSSIIHFKGESTRKEPMKYLKMFYQAMVVFVNKHYKGNRAWLTRSVLKTGIGIRGLAGWFIDRKPEEKHNIPHQVIVVGTADSYVECAKILSNETDVQPIVHINPTDVNDITAVNEASQLVFCTGDIALNNAMHLMQKLDSSFDFRFHAKGSNSIIGSDSKESIGVTIASH